MAFGKSLPLAKRRKAADGPVFCVGHTAFVHWPQRRTTVPAAMVPATDRDGGPLENDLVDGQEVEILSWQPRSSRGLLYEIRRVDDHEEYWIAAVHLRATGSDKTSAGDKYET